MAGRKLKVFQAQFGFYDSVVAVPSQAAALRAWGIHQNMFASGEAKPATDEAAIAAALAHPDVPLRRPVGSKAPFELEPSSLPTVPAQPKRAREPAGPATGARSRKPEPKPKSAPPPPPPPDRSVLDAAEAALGRLDQARKREEADFQDRQKTLDAKKISAQQAYVEARQAATAAVVAARKAYRMAGGKG